MTAQKTFQLVASFGDLQKALDGALYVQVCRCMLIAVIYIGSCDRSRKELEASKSVYCSPPREYCHITLLFLKCLHIIQ